MANQVLGDRPGPGDSESKIANGSGAQWPEFTAKGIQGNSSWFIAL